MAGACPSRHRKQAAEAASASSLTGAASATPCGLGHLGHHLLFFCQLDLGVVKSHLDEPTPGTDAPHGQWRARPTAASVIRRLAQGHTRFAKYPGCVCFFLGAFQKKEAQKSMADCTRNVDLRTGTRTSVYTRAIARHRLDDDTRTPRFGNLHVICFLISRKFPKKGVHEVRVCVCVCVCV